MSLFSLGDYTLHSGSKSKYKIDCDHLTDADWECIAYMIFEKLPSRFGRVIGVPQGGLKLAECLFKYRSSVSPFTLIVDDVLTTGRSMEEERKKEIVIPTIGAVFIARGKCPDWVTPLLRME